MPSSPCWGYKIRPLRNFGERNTKKHLTPALRWGQVLKVYSTPGSFQQASAASRAAGSGCPYCVNLKIQKGYNDFTIELKAIVKFYGRICAHLPTQISRFTIGALSSEQCYSCFLLFKRLKTRSDLLYSDLIWAKKKNMVKSSRKINRKNLRLILLRSCIYV